MTDLCLVPLSSLIICSSSSSAAIRRFALASVEVGTAPERSACGKACWTWPGSGTDSDSDIVADKADETRNEECVVSTTVTVWVKDDSTRKPTRTGIYIGSLKYQDI